MGLETLNPKTRYQQGCAPYKPCRGLFPCLFLASGGLLVITCIPWLVGCITPILHLHMVFSLCLCPNFSFLKGHKPGAVLRWQRNRRGRPLSSPQIDRNIWMLTKPHKTISEHWQKTPGSQKGSPFSSKGGRAKFKDKKRDERVRDGDPSLGGSHEGGKVSKYQETLPLAVLWGVLESWRATLQGGKKKKIHRLRT